MRPRSRVWIVFMVVGLLTCGCIKPPQPDASMPASGDKPAWPMTAVLQLDPPESFTVGTAVKVPLYLHNLSGRSLPNKLLLIYLDGQLLRRARTDEDGRGEIYLGRELPVGTYQLRTVAVETEAYEQTTSEVAIHVRPARLTVSIVPPLPGIAFSLGNAQFRSDKDGIAAVDVTSTGLYTLTMLPTTPQADGNSTPMLVEFDRWADQHFSPQRTVEIRGDVDLYLGLSRSYQIGQRFVNLEGIAVDAARISNLTIKSSYGMRYSYGDGEPRWRSANRIARLKNGLEATAVQYAVERVIIDGTNVVNQNQQRFYVDGPATWTIELLLYSAEVRASDAFFGFPIGTGINLHFPDGSVRYYPFEQQRSVQIKDLARGMYKVQVTGTHGMAPLTPVAISRNQDVHLKVLSLWDIGTAFTFGWLFAFGLLFWGRPQLFSPAWWRKRGTQSRRAGDELWIAHGQSRYEGETHV